jgi:hypothetical protein
MVAVRGVPSGPLLEFESGDRYAMHTVRVLQAAANAAGGYARLDPSDFRLVLDR